tara:strand:+ start:1798 stop:2949 length:1152 start_codon:yes stop_codon:yes gene_type:complete
MLGIFIGIAAVVSLISLGQGMEEALTATFANLGTDKLVIQAASTMFAPPGSLAVTPLTKDDIDIVRRTQGVKVAIGRLLRGVTAEHNELRVQNFAISIPEDLEERRLIVEAVDLQVEDGRLFRNGDRFKVLLGADFATEDNAFQKKMRIGEKITLNDKKFEVIGILKRISAPFGNDGFMLMDDTLRELINEDEEVDLINVQVEKGADVTKVADTITKKFRRDRNQDIGEEDFTVQTPEQASQTFGSILLIMQIVVIGIAGISLIVGGVGITNAMFTSVLERTKEVGIMKAIGATNKDVMTFFMIESGILGMTGGIIGILMGVAMSGFVEIVGKNVLGSDLLRANFSIYLIVGALLFSFFIGTVSGVVPAMQASKMAPVEALRQ